MAATIDTCDERVSELAAKIESFPVVSAEDLQTLEPLLTEFATEITTLRGRSAAVSDLAARKIVVFTESGRMIVTYEQFTISGPNHTIPIANPSDRSSSRYEVAAIINVCAEEYHKRGIKLRKIAAAADFLSMQRTFAEELVTFQERNREVERQKCLAQTCE